jgi:hypothetical protein
MADIDTKILGRWIVLWCDVCEETLELFFAVLLMTSLGLKYARDYRPGAATL